MLPGNTPSLNARKGDPFTKALLHFDGANGFTGPFPDSANLSRSWNSNGGASLTTSQSKFGGAALNIALGQYVSTASSPDFEFGAGDFTIDWWEYPVNYPNGSCVMSRDWGATFGGGWLIGYAIPGATQVYLTSNGSAWDIASGQPLASVAGGVWHHSAVARQGSTFWTFKNGVVQATWSSALAIMASSGSLGIGVAQSSANIAMIIEELRISKGIARWTANFTPPTAPYSQ